MNAMLKMAQAENARARESWGETPMPRSQKISNSLHQTATKRPTCPNCDGCRSRVIETRPREMAGQVTVVRRRKCYECDTRWTTQEVSQDFLSKLMEFYDAMLSSTADN